MPKRNQIIQTPISTATSHSDEESMTEDVEKPFQPNSELSSSSIFRWCFSIKFCLSFLIAVFILFGVVIISAVWLGTLIPPNVVLSQDVRRADFNGIISKISRTLQEVELSTEAMKSQMNPLLDFNDFEKFELALYSAYKYDFQKTQGLVKTSHFGDNKGNGIGMTMIPSMGPILFNFTPAQAVVYFCNPDFDKYDHCKRNAAPDMVSSSGSTADFMNRCNAYPNLSSWFQSFVMETSVNFDTFVNFVTCFKLDVPDAKGNKFRQFFYKSLTVVSFSEYLHNMTMTISGSKSFIVELGTDYLLASKL
ncbi:hypothetical protein C9374_000394 [Naegleria lovaniensis]|uniref:Uncharacterized protein n=1 Tax=Naegleria lovaniensis TaxID=51637 RepID=A0AA88GCR6_NAELO|nr:uncharacterized protein C9374_000394 [Naegleria lovaniensis]KAG2370565.1 hypothetical protein C9374_000394 [Naegleria lovaniensis]